MESVCRTYRKDNVNNGVIYSYFEKGSCPVGFQTKKYDASKTFNQNLPIILNLDNDTIARTQEDKTTFLKSLVEMDREKRLSEYLWNGISLFYEIYENEMSLVQQHG